MKKRYFALLAIAVLFALSFVLKPVRPFIQLPGECYPGDFSMKVIGSIPGFPCWTNTFSATLLTWGIVALIALMLRARNRRHDEVPSGFYNFFEMIIEGAFNFVEGIAGAKKAREFFPFFMTWILIILVSNWLGLMPGFDSIGIWEHKPTFELHKAEKAHEPYDINKVDKKNKGDIRNGLFLFHKGDPWFGADESAPIQTIAAHGADHGDDHSDDGHGADYPAAEHDPYVGRNPEAADWTIVPFFRPASTDLNLTLAFAIMAMVLVQYFGFKHLGARGYLSKFFPFIAPGFGASVSENPIKAIDIFVGLLELVGEISKVISFAFRLLGNIFAGMVLLFVMAFLLPVANVAFFGLEFFVGIIQALVFALLMVIFMNGATESHGDHGDHGHDDGHGHDAVKAH